LNEGIVLAKYFEIIMAGIISGTVALTTSILGIGGTVIGAVLGAIFYQIISIFVKEPLKNTNIRRVENEVVYILPLILIAILLIIFIMAYFNTEFFDYYNQLKVFTDNNLLRLMGIGLIAMGIYPLIQTKNIDKKYAGIVLFLGILLFFRGLIDIDDQLLNLYIIFIGKLDFIVPLAILLPLLFVIFKIFLESVKLYREREKSSILIETNSNKFEELHHSEKIRSSKTSTMSKNKDALNKITYNKPDNNAKYNENQNKDNKGQNK
jgi:hypothetical protein